MTREEAKVILKGFMENPLFSDIPKVCRAFDMAIKALEQEPYTNVGKYKDAISRQAVRDTIFAECSGTKLDIDFAKVLILQRAIKALPPVQPKSRWIPVSEKLPEKDGDYLATIKWKGSYSGDVYTETNMAVYREKEKEWDCAGVIAWQPLPEPYEPSN